MIEEQFVKDFWYISVTANIYIPIGKAGFEFCYPVEGDDFETIHVLINGTPQEQDWIPIQMKLVRTDRKKKLIESDVPWFESHALIFRPAAISLFGEVLLGYGELLPLTCPGHDLVVFNVTNVLNALDIEKSTVNRFSDGGLMMIRKYQFHPEIIGDNEIFKIPDLRVSPTFVNQQFVDRWTASGLTGLDFEHIWSSPD